MSVQGVGSLRALLVAFAAAEREEGQLITGSPQCTAVAETISSVAQQSISEALEDAERARHALERVGFQVRLRSELPNTIWGLQQTTDVPPGNSFCTVHMN